MISSEVALGTHPGDNGVLPVDSDTSLTELRHIMAREMGDHLRQAGTRWITSG